jgi:hypothetical protein
MDHNNDIILDYEIFDCCIAILTEATTRLKSLHQALTSSATYVLSLAMVNALNSLPCETVKNELFSLLQKHGWDEAKHQFVGVLDMKHMEH